jgi:hypothetical protein
MWDVVWSFVGVFVGAFLAIGLENVRERRVTRRWVFGHLAHLLDQIEQGWRRIENSTRGWELARDAVDRWLAAESADDMDEADWTAIGQHSSTTQLDLGHVLRTEALNVVPPDVAQALAEAEVANTISRSNQAAIRSEFDLDIRELWYQRRIPLDETARRRLHAYRGSLTRAVDVDRATADAVLELGRILRPTRAGRRAGG